MAEDGAPAGLDPTAAGRLRRLGGDDLVRRMGEMFLALGEERLAAARSGLAGGDLDALERAAHSLKSSAGNLGATALADRASRLEQPAGAARAARLEETTAAAGALPDLLAAMEEAFERAAADIRRLLEAIE